MFFLGALILFTSFSALNNVQDIRPLYLREHDAGFYSPTAWLIARFLYDLLPLRLIPSIIVSTIVYFMVGLNREPALFFKFLLVILEFTVVATLYNFLLGVVFAHMGVAMLTSALFVMANLVYAGFFINLMQIPPVLRWVHYIMPLPYTLEALTVNAVGAGLQIIDVLVSYFVETSLSLCHLLTFAERRLHPDWRRRHHEHIVRLRG
jgi:ABC-type multidrug transport system permease subunit